MQFSIVIPTRNRAGKLRHALQSALAQQYDDFEVVVSNNCSTDDTALVIAAERSPHLRYVRAPKSMSMPDHWQFALSQTQGDWVLFLCDDDALMPGALAALAKIATAQPDNEIIQYGLINYFYDDGTVQHGNFVDVPGNLPVGKYWRQNSRRVLELNFRRLGGDMPKFLNCAVRRSLITRIHQQFGRMFWDWAPDYSSATLLLANTKRFIRTGPLMLWGENVESYGAGSARNPEQMLAFFNQFESFKGELPYSPYPQLLTVQNCVFDTFQRVRNQLGPKFNELRTDPVRLTYELIKDCRKYVENGHADYESRMVKLRSDLYKLRRQRMLDLLWAWQSLHGGLVDVLSRTGRSLYRRWTGQKRRERKYFDNICEAAAAVGQQVCPVESTKSKVPPPHFAVPKKASTAIDAAADRAA